MGQKRSGSEKFENFIQQLVHDAGVQMLMACPWMRSYGFQVVGCMTGGLAVSKENNGLSHRQVSEDECPWPSLSPQTPYLSGLHIDCERMD